jgi:hypothetical protein
LPDSIGITGLVVLGGNTSIKDPTANFKNSFSGTSDATVYGATNALMDIVFSYQGYTNAFNVVNEVKVGLVQFSSCHFTGFMLTQSPPGKNRILSKLFDGVLLFP